MFEQPGMRRSVVEHLARSGARHPADRSRQPQAAPAVEPVPAQVEGITRTNLNEVPPAGSTFTGTHDVFPPIVSLVRRPPAAAGCLNGSRRLLIRARPQVSAVGGVRVAGRYTWQAPRRGRR